MNNGNRIFHGAAYRITAPFGEWRDNHTRQHMGTDYGTYSKSLIQYCPLDDGKVVKMITNEAIGNPRGICVEIHFIKHNLGLILQHGSKILCKISQTANRKTPLLVTGMTGKDKNGKRVSTGIHCHAELFELSTGKRLDFDKFDFEKLEDKEMTEQQVIDIVYGILNGKNKPVSSGAQESFARCKALGVVDGSNPDMYVTKEVVSSMIDRFDKAVNKR